MHVRSLPSFAQASSLWHEAHLSQHLGCSDCPDHDLCGGLQTRAPFIDCRELCPCNWGRPCTGVCRRDHKTFIKRLNEVAGFRLDNVPRAAAVAATVEMYVPMVYDASNRVRTLSVETVAIPFMSLFDKRTGNARVHSRAELLRRFRLSDRARIVLSGVDRDSTIEAWWSFSNRPALIELMRRIGIALITAPNYSMILNVPRQDNLHNMKRIALVWQEILAGGVACALHLNARTPHDYERWRDFAAERPEVTHVAFEFATGAGNRTRSPYHAEELVRVAEDAGRPLHLVVRGGRRHWRQLAGAFAGLTVLDPEPYVKTKKRQRPDEQGDWYSSPTLDGEPLDDLLLDNIAHCRDATARHIQPLSVGGTDRADIEAEDVGALP